MNRNVEPSIRLNGEEFPWTPGMTLASLIAALVDTPALVVAELNGVIFPQEGFERASVHPGDAVEVIRMVGGG